MTPHIPDMDEMTKENPKQNASYITELFHGKQRYRTNENFLLREIGGENLLIPVGEAGIYNNTMITLNATCCFIWKQYEQPRTIQEVVTEILTYYTGDEATIVQDVCQFTIEALQSGLLREESK